jgi:hypothetical protein
MENFEQTDRKPTKDEIKAELSNLDQEWANSF